MIAAGGRTEATAHHCIAVFWAPKMETGSHKEGKEERGRMERPPAADHQHQPGAGQ